MRHIRLTSFSPYKGPYVRADIVLDMRNSPDPYCEPELEHKTGISRRVQRYVFQYREEKKFLDEIVEEVLANESIEHVAAFCVGGHHRSPSMIERLSKRLREHGIETDVWHRQIRREHAIA